MKITDLVIGDSVVHIAQPSRTGVVEGFTFRESRGYIACQRVIASHVRVRFAGHIGLSYDPAMLRLPAPAEPAEPAATPRRFLVVGRTISGFPAVDCVIASTAKAAAERPGEAEGTVDVIDEASGAHTRFRVSRQPTAIPVDTPEPSPTPS